MIRNTRGGRPALEGFGGFLLSGFPALFIRNFRVKQMAGEMAAQILEQRGFRRTVTRRRCADQLFSRAMVFI